MLHARYKVCMRCTNSACSPPGCNTALLVVYCRRKRAKHESWKLITQGAPSSYLQDLMTGLGHQIQVLKSSNAFIKRTGRCCNRAHAWIR